MPQVARYPRLSIYAMLAILFLSTVVSGARSEVPDVAPGVDPRSILYYRPSKGGNLVFCVLYLATALGLYWNLFKRKDYWALCLPIGATFQSLGFALRLPYGNNPSSLGLYIIQDFCVVLSPACYFAINYIIFGRLSANLVRRPDIPGDARRLTVILPRLFGLIFILSDVSTFIIQASGGAMQTNRSLVSVGEKIFLAGIILQFGSYVFFLILVIRCNFIIRKSLKVVEGGQGIQRLFWVLYYSSVWILVRSVYRTIELKQGFRGTLMRNENYFFALDSAPLLLAITCYIPFWPTRFTSLSLEPAQTNESGDKGNHVPLTEWNASSNPTLVDAAPNQKK